MRGIRCGPVVTECSLSVCQCNYPLVTTISCVETAEPIEMLFGMWTRGRPRNHVLNRSPRKGSLLGVILVHVETPAADVVNIIRKRAAAMRPTATTTVPTCYNQGRSAMELIM